MYWTTAEANDTAPADKVWKHALGVAHKGRPHRGGGVGQVGHLADSGGGGQGHADVCNASENRVENAENRVKIARKSVKTKKNSENSVIFGINFGHVTDLSAIVTRQIRLGNT